MKRDEAAAVVVVVVVLVAINKESTKTKMHIFISNVCYPYVYIMTGIDCKRQIIFHSFEFGN